MLQINNTIKKKKSKIKLSAISFSNVLICLLIVLILIITLLDSKKYSSSVVNGITLFFTAVFPGLLPSMFLCTMLTKLDISSLFKPLNKVGTKLFGISYNGLYALFISLVSGYPVGAKITRDLYKSGYIDQNEATRTAMISSTSGASFTIGTVGSVMLKNAKFGIIIYISNMLAVLVYSFLYHILTKKKMTMQSHQISKSIQEKKSFLQLMSSCVIDTIKGLLIVGFYITLFSLIIELFNMLILARLPNLSRTFKCVMSGIIEMTSGINNLSTNLSKLSISLVAMLTGFSGISIVMQSIEFLGETKIKTYKFFIAKLFHGLLSFTICFVLLSIFKI